MYPPAGIFPEGLDGVVSFSFCLKGGLIGGVRCSTATGQVNYAGYSLDGLWFVLTQRGRGWWFQFISSP
jgi:hypothetical protein